MLNVLYRIPTDAIIMKLHHFLALVVLSHHVTIAVRLHKLFQFIDGHRSEHKLQGFLHIGEDYAVLLRVPFAHDKYLVYELYESKNTADVASYKPRLLAISRVPIQYIKDQLRIFRRELYKAKYVDDNVVPGTQVRTLREWQIERALNFHDKQNVDDRLPLLKTVL